MLKYGLVGSWESQPVKGPTLQELETWAKMAWRLKGNVLFYTLNRNLLYLEFDSAEETNWVLENGSRIYRGDVIHLVWWNPFVRCVDRKDQAFEAWIKVVDLPLHLWTREILKEVGDSCGGFLVMDKEIALKIELRWARILVKMEDKKKSSYANLLVGARSYEI